MGLEAERAALEKQETQDTHQEQVTARSRFMIQSFYCHYTVPCTTKIRRQAEKVQSKKQTSISIKSITCHKSKGRVSIHKGYYNTAKETQ